VLRMISLTLTLEQLDDIGETADAVKSEMGRMHLPPTAGRLELLPAVMRYYLVEAKPLFVANDDSMIISCVQGLFNCE